MASSSVNDAVLNKASAAVVAAAPGAKYHERVSANRRTHTHTETHWHTHSDTHTGTHTSLALAMLMYAHISFQFPFWLRVFLAYLIMVFGQAARLRLPLASRSRSSHLVSARRKGLGTLAISHLCARHVTQSQRAHPAK